MSQSLAELTLPLRHQTKAAWVDVVRADFPGFLLDHAACERKAAALCLSLVSRFPEFPLLVDPLVSIAREELEHFALVHRLIQRRGIAPRPDEPDPYVNGLLKGVRHARDVHLLDRLVVASLIEARSCERFALLAKHLTDPELAGFYQTLMRSEAGHFRAFLRLAEKCFEPAQVAQRLDELLSLEAQVSAESPLRPAMH